jgi:Domain of unknown function (DUF4258)
MRERHIRPREVVAVLEAGEVIEDYADDRPYASALLCGKAGPRDLHVVAARLPDPAGWVVITVYEPDPREWESGFKKRKAP